MHIFETGVHFFVIGQCTFLFRMVRHVFSLTEILIYELSVKLLVFTMTFCCCLKIGCKNNPWKKLYWSGEFISKIN